MRLCDVIETETGELILPSLPQSHSHIWATQCAWEVESVSECAGMRGLSCVLGNHSNPLRSPDCGPRKGLEM
jgi:hypothetical protein